MTAPRRKVLLLALGGTIACVKTGKGLVPKLRAADLVSAISLPRGVEVVSKDFLKRLIVFPKDWIALGREIFNQFENYDGFVVTLGTDTLAYVAAALSLILRNISKPIVLTGAMRPISDRKSDGGMNLYNAILTAGQSGVGGVFVVFNGKILEGGRVSKIRSEDADAFESVNASPLGTFSGNKIRWNERPACSKEKPTIVPFLDTRVALVKLAPNTQPAFFNGFKKYRGIVIEGYGDGNVSFNLVPVLKRLARERVVILASQCPYGKSSPKYKGGVSVIQAGAIPAENMTKEMSLVKLMWVLGQSKKLADARRIF